MSINPWKQIPQLYTQPVMERYKGKSFAECEPHIYGVCDDMYRNMVRNAQSQSMLVRFVPRMLALFAHTHTVANDEVLTVLREAANQAQAKQKLAKAFCSTSRL